MLYLEFYIRLSSHLVSFFFHVQLHHNIHFCTVVFIYLLLGIAWTILVARKSLLPQMCFPLPRGTLVAQWVKRWPADLEVPSSIPAHGEIFSAVNEVPLQTAFHDQPSIILIRLKYC